MVWLRVWFCFVILGAAAYGRTKLSCRLPHDVVKEIKSYQGFVNEVIQTVVDGPYKGKFYEDLAQFTDKYGARITGSQVLDLSIKELAEKISEANLATTLEDVKAPLWLRGRESAYYITKFRKKRLRIKALGGSASGNVTGVLMIVKNLDELEKRKAEVPGKVVLFSSKFTNYSYDVVSRAEGPGRASFYGAVGALVRSITPFSIGTIHVGGTDFDNVTAIPAASVSTEDADLLTRLAQNEEVKINLIIKNKAENGTTTSQNLIIDIPGASEPYNYVIVSGHIDSWDVGQGVLDDAGGAFLAMHTLLLLKYLNVSAPQRTLKGILWTAEEVGNYGAKAYAEIHGDELKNWTMAFESDGGLYKPTGFRTNGNEEAICLLKTITSLFKEINTTEVMAVDGTVSSDVSVFHEYFVPLMEPLMEENNYYWFHHTQGDDMDLMNSDYMDLHLALIAGTAYILANMSIPLPRVDTKYQGVPVDQI